MKKLREMKKNNKGFSLVELIVVIAIMVVLIAVLGSTILGYVEKSKYSKDIQALDSVKTAVSTFVSDPDAKYNDDYTYKLSTLMTGKITVNGTEYDIDPNDVITKTLKEVFPDGTNFEASSNAFTGVKTDDVYVSISDGAVSIFVKSKDTDYASYKAGTAYKTTEPSAEGAISTPVKPAT